MIFDTHAHYDLEQFDYDRDEILKTMTDNGVGRIVNAASDVASWQAVLDLIQKYPNVYGSIGVHPDLVNELNEEHFAKMRQLALTDKIVAIGEIGLDYYWDVVEHEEQKKWFIRQLDLARELELPVMIHSREAAADTLAIMKQYAKGLNGVLHCFSYSVEMAHEYIKLGFYIGVGGVVTFKNGRKLKEVVEGIPLSSIVLETDCPYLAPVPYRGKRNISSYLTYVAEEIAKLKGISYDEVVEQTTKNANQLYRLP